MFGASSSSDPRRPDRIHRQVKILWLVKNLNSYDHVRYKASAFNQNQNGEDLTPDYMNVLGMVFSMCGLMMRVSQSISSPINKYIYIYFLTGML